MSSIIQTKRGPACRLRTPTSKVWWTPSTETCRIRLIKVWEITTKCLRGVSVLKLALSIHCLIDLGLPKGLTDMAIWDPRDRQSRNPPPRKTAIRPRQSSDLWVYWEASNSKTLMFSKNSYNYSGTTKSCNRLWTIIEMPNRNNSQSTSQASKRQRTSKTRNMRSPLMNCSKVWTTLGLRRKKQNRIKSTRTTSCRDSKPKTKATTRMRVSMLSFMKMHTTLYRIFKPNRNVNSSLPWPSQAKNLINCSFLHLGTRGRSVRKWSSSSNPKTRREMVQTAVRIMATGLPNNQI